MKIKELKAIIADCDNNAEVYLTYTYYHDNVPYETIEDVTLVDVLPESICISGY